MEVQANQITFRSYLTFWSGQLVSLLGSSIASFVIIWWVTVEMESAIYLAIASLLSFAPMIILAPFAGVFVDRWSRRALIGFVDFLQALATLVLIFLFSLGHVLIWQVLALLTLRGVFQAFHNPAVSAIIPLMVPRDKLSRINGLNFLLSGAVSLVGPVLAALLLDSLEIGRILWIDAATFIVAVIPLLMIKIPSVTKKQGERKERSSFKTEFAEGFGFIRKARGFLTLIVVATALNFLLTPLSTIMPYFVKFDHFGTASDLALVLACFQGGILVGGLLMSVTKGFSKKMVASAVSICVIFLGAALIALTPTGLFWFMALGALITALCLPIANVSIQTIVQTVVPLNLQGRVNSVIGSLASAASPFGMILSGIIVEYTRTANLLFGFSIAGLMVMAFSWFLTDIRYVEEMEKKQDSNPQPSACAH